MTSVHFITQGRSVKISNTETMAGLLKEAKFDVTDSLEDADIVVFNTCTVTNTSESTFFKELEKITIDYPYKTIVIAGCISQSDSTHPILKKYCLIGVGQIHRIVEVVEEALNDNIIQALESGEMTPLNLPKLRKNPIIGIIQINQSALSACTSCKIESSKINLKSYPVEEIVKEAKKCILDGCKEIWLASQNTFCYGFDIGTDIAALIERLVVLEGKFMIRVGMGDPECIPKIKDKLIQAYKNPKVFKFLHLPLQSGNNKILKDIARMYTIEDFNSIISDFKREIPNLNVMTDIIVGYPTESETQFFDTLTAVRLHSFDSINISSYWQSPGTKSGKLKQLDAEEIRRRSSVLRDIFHNISFLQNEKWVGWKGKVLVDEKNGEQWIGRNYCYKQILLEGDFKLGEQVSVEVVKAERFALKGKVKKI